MKQREIRPRLRKGGADGWGLVYPRSTWSSVKDLEDVVFPLDFYRHLRRVSKCSKVIAKEEMRGEEIEFTWPGGSRTYLGDFMDRKRFRGFQEMDPVGIPGIIALDYGISDHERSYLEWRLGG